MRRKDVYYKDAVGNISTSNFRNEARSSILEFEPRYPLYGGWKFSWFHGYSVPFANFLSTYNGFYDSFELNVTMTPSVKNLYVATNQLKVILPEGAL